MFYVNPNNHAVYLKDPAGKEIKVRPIAEKGTPLPKSANLVVEGEHYERYVKSGRLRLAKPSECPKQQTVEAKVVQDDTKDSEDNTSTESDTTEEEETSTSAGGGSKQSNRRGKRKGRRS